MDPLDLKNEFEGRKKYDSSGKLVEHEVAMHSTAEAVNF